MKGSRRQGIKGWGRVIIHVVKSGEGKPQNQAEKGWKRGGENPTYDDGKSRRGGCGKGL